MQEVERREREGGGGRGGWKKTNGYLAPTFINYLHHFIQVPWLSG